MMILDSGLLFWTCSAKMNAELSWTL